MHNNNNGIAKKPSQPFKTLYITSLQVKTKTLGTISTI